ncbi:hypothetical protein Nepgr_028363 [Nepenthes gracilis]|uniref:C2H2-type domain-containing protein n=1 Tax=Nepenthes gracilis TaxID=150966 RepID=A0AAD3Y3V6_NEPGR|nr:hypothetical protein Nepgr_028363 [Nepenthes gracilis]
MGTDPQGQSTAKSGQTEESIWVSSSSKSSPYHRYQTTSGSPYSYTCNFCKKGFSNAQALGGHMNIHRRVRAKLRQSSSSEDKKIQSVGAEKEYFDQNPPARSESSDHDDDEGGTLKRPWIDRVLGYEGYQGRDEMGKLLLRRPLPSFVDGAYCMEDREESARDVAGRDDRSPALDLELRLGSEPRQVSTVLGKRECSS